MSLAAAMVCLLALAGPNDRAVPAETVAVSMVAVEASNESGGVREAGAGKRFSPGLDGATRAALEELPYNTFRKIGDGSVKAKLDQEARLKIDDTYTLCVQPLSKDPTGIIRAKVWIEERREDADAREPVRKALVTTVKAVSGDKMILGGLKLAKGDLVVALTLKG